MSVLSRLEIDAEVLESRWREKAERRITGNRLSQAAEHIAETPALLPARP
jgi:hypothetical protein